MGRRALDAATSAAVAAPRVVLQGIDNTEIIDTVHARRAPMVPVRSSLHL